MRDQIFDYVNGHLTEEEKSTFELEMAKDKQLALEVEEFQNLKSAISASLENDVVGYPTINWKPVLVLAALFLVFWGMFGARPIAEDIPGPFILQTDDPKIQVVLLPQIPIQAWEQGGSS